jgi:hypothetical protein
MGPLVMPIRHTGEAGSRAKVSQIYEAAVDTAEPSYDVEFGDFKVHLSETKLLELFDVV